MARRPAIIPRTKKKPRSTKSEGYLVNQKYLGDEPTFAKNVEQNISRAFNWYNAMCDVNDAREYSTDYFKKTNNSAMIKVVKAIPDKLFPMTSAWVFRMISRGANIDDEMRERAIARLLAIKSDGESVVEDFKENKPTNVINIQDRIREKANDIIGSVEELIDRGEEFSLYDWLKSNEIPATYAPRIAAFYAPVLGELLEASEGIDPQLKEGYKNFNKKQLEARILMFNNIIEDAERYADTTKKVRKPRKPRAVSVEKKLKNFKFQKEDNTFKIASVNPEKIIGSQELWTFNTKYKTLTVFRALDRGGLQIKGTSIINYDENTSVTKRTGRKPEVYVDKVLNGGKVVLRKLMDELKNDAPLAYRINENTILLKVVS
jgi:hypothetical protein